MAGSSRLTRRSAMCLRGPDDQLARIEVALDRPADVEQPGRVDVRPAQTAELTPPRTGHGSEAIAAASTGLRSSAALKS
jgi:hypothetical protein